MADEEDKGYTVGYKKPPKHSRFVPGQSGNRGRSKRKETAGEMIARVRDEIVEVNGKRITKLELAFTQAMNQAIRSGKPKDLKTLCEMFEQYAPMPVEDEGEKARVGAEAVYLKIMHLFEHQEGIDHEDVVRVETLADEEAKIVMACPHCGDTLRKRWGTPERKALLKRYGTSGLHKDVLHPFLTTKYRSNP